MVEFSMDDHSADPKLKISRADPKTNDFTVRIQKNDQKQMQRSKE